MVLDVSSRHEVGGLGARRQVELVCQRLGAAREALAPGAVVGQMEEVRAWARRLQLWRRDCGKGTVVSTEVEV